MHQKKIAIINDISSFGRCSTAVILPIVSHLGIQGCPLPTALFSNHTGFKSFFRLDFTRHIEQYMDEWHKIGLKFDGIMSGFLGSEKQIDIVKRFIREFRSEKSVVIIDPVMGDYGRLYDTYTSKMQTAMKKLLNEADIITPNLTEACFLTDTPYKERGWKHQELATICHKLNVMGARQIVITGIRIGKQFVGNVVMLSNGHVVFQRQQIIERIRSGTGDVFASVLAADAVNGVSFERSVHRAAHFVRRSLLASEKYSQPNNYGICFEEALSCLKTEKGKAVTDKD